ncbi:hypothetical protein BDF19DRAFT_437696 [Syncephalis fuscata]|nr:hypothetical protein BDF19DRAFT_437696 [Syncephalis fuscata]
MSIIDELPLDSSPFLFKKDLRAFSANGAKASSSNDGLAAEGCGKVVSSIKYIKVFDFDNTLFRSPLPSPHLWHNNLIGKLMSPEVGWFKNIKTLSEPYVVCKERTDESSATASNQTSWFSSKILQEARDAIAAPDTCAILLTGRSRDIYYFRIKELLIGQDLHFDAIILREYHSLLPSTMQFKQYVIRYLLELLKCAREVTIWEDRNQHVRQFQNYMATLEKSGRLDKTLVVQVKPFFCYMKAHLELQLVHELIVIYNTQIPKEKIELVNRIKSGKLKLGRVALQHLRKYCNIQTEHQLNDYGVWIPSSIVLNIDVEQANGYYSQQVQLFLVNFKCINNTIVAILATENISGNIEYPLGKHKSPMRLTETCHKASLDTFPMAFFGSLELTCVKDIKKCEPFKSYSTSIYANMSRIIQQYHPDLQDTELTQMCCRVKQVIVKNNIQEIEELKHIVKSMKFNQG